MSSNFTTGYLKMKGVKMKTLTLSLSLSRSKKYLVRSPHHINHAFMNMKSIEGRNWCDEASFLDGKHRKYVFHELNTNDVILTGDVPVTLLLRPFVIWTEKVKG